MISLVIVLYIISMIYIRSIHVTSLLSISTSSLLSSLSSSSKLLILQTINAIIIVYLLSSSSFSNSDLYFYLIMTLLSLTFYKYLYKSSRYITTTISINNNNNKNNVNNVLKQRNIFDKLVISSLSYGLMGLLAIYNNESIFGVMLIFTSICSASYHYHYEAIYFNADNILATSIGVIYLRTLYISFIYYHDNELLCISGTLGLFIAAFLLVYCGMPAIITIKSDCCIRSINPFYAFIHTIWHIISSLGPLFSILITQYLKNNNIVSSNSILGSDYYILDLFPLWPTISILIGTLLNCFGNIFGIMPVS